MGLLVTTIIGTKLFPLIYFFVICENVSQKVVHKTAKNVTHVGVWFLTIL